MINMNLANMIIFGYKIGYMDLSLLLNKGGFIKTRGLRGIGGI